MVDPLSMTEILNHEDYTIFFNNVMHFMGSILEIIQYIQTI